MAIAAPMTGGRQLSRAERVATDTGRTLLPFIRRLRPGLAARLALYTAILGTVVTAVLTSYMYRGSVEALITGELHELAATNQAAGLRLDTRFAFAREDALILARLPAAAALATARLNEATSPTGIADVEQARANLAATFRTMLEERPGYIQLRYVTADGQEVVRMERLPDGTIEAEPWQALRNLGDRPYVRNAMGLANGDVYVSEVGFNQPDGTIEQPPRSVVRVAAPARDQAGHLLGVVVVNVDLHTLFSLVTQTVRQQSLHFITDRNGDYLYRTNAPEAFTVAARESSLIQDALPQLAPIFAQGGASFSGIVGMGGRRYVTAARRIYYDTRQPDRYLVLATLWPRSHVEAEITTLRNQTLLVAGALLVFGVVAVFLLAGGLVRPLRALTDATTQIAAGNHDIQVTAAASKRDEVGELARSIEIMATEIRAREDEVRIKAEDLQRSNKELNQFAYVASHDLQEPLRMVDSYLNLLVRRYGDRLDGDAHEFIGFAVDGARRMKALINDLLAYSRVSSRPLDLDDVDIAAVVANVVKMLGERIAESGAEISVAALPHVGADATQMERLFMNVIENAVKYRGEAPPLIRIAAERRGRMWEVSVADNGIGIPPEFREKVFDIFARLQGRDKYPGSGIGLASCRRIVERHGGEIWVDATPGGGTTFRFTLPDRTAATEAGDA